jgi:hypothetical protein
MALPGCVAWMVQVPAMTTDTVAPETKQTADVIEANLMGRPDVAVALIVKFGAPTTRLGRTPKLMVWLAVPFCAPFCITVIC